MKVDSCESHANSNCMSLTVAMVCRLCFITKFESYGFILCYMSNFSVH
jgi:hypothetical protein